MRWSRPFYTIQLALYGCVPEVRINDGPVFEDPDGACGVVEVPANDWIVDGENRLSLLLRPLPGEAALDARTDVEAVVYVREVDETREQRREVARLSFTFATPSDPRPHVPGQSSELHLDSVFKAQGMLPRWRWLTGVPVADRQRAFAQVLAELRAFRAQLEAGDLEGLLSRLSLRDAETARALYVSPEQRQAVTRGEFAELVSSGTYEAALLEEQGLSLRLFGQNRLARLDAANGESPLWYYDRDSSLAVYLPLVFFQQSPGSWIVCR